MYFMADSVVQLKKLPFCVKPVVYLVRQCLQQCKQEASQEACEIRQFLLSLCIWRNWQEFGSRATAGRSLSV